MSIQSIRKKSTLKFPLSINQQHDLSERIVKSEDSALYIWYALTMNTARRAQQLASLKWSDIHEGLRLRMPDKSDYFAIDFLDIKTNHVQRIWVTIGLLTYLEAWKHSHPANKTYVFHPVKKLDIDHDVPIFCLKMNQKLNRLLKVIVTNSNKQKELNIASPHMLLRRCAVTNAVYRMERSDYVAFLLALPQELCEI